MPPTSFLLHRFQISCHADTATVSVKTPGHVISGITATATVARGGAGEVLDLLRGGVAALQQRGTLATLTVRRNHGWIQSEWWASAAAGEATLTVGVRLFDPTHEVRVESVRAVAIPWSGTHLAAEIGQARWWIFPSSAWDRPGTRPIVQPATPEDCTSIAYDIAGAYAPSGRALTVAHLLPSRWINRIDATAESLAILSTVGVKVPARGTLSLDDCRIDADRPIVDALAAVGSLHRGRRTAAESVHHWGWNAWDYFTDKILERDIDQAVRVIGDAPALQGRVRYLVVDDFWQTMTGDWQPGSRFGSIQRAAATIRQAGFSPGIWTAPFMVDRNSDLLKQHPEFALKLHDDRLYSHCMGCDPPWGDRCYLDPTHPGLPEHLFSLYRRLYSWGFRYFKTDFLTNAISAEFPGESAKYQGQIRYHDPDLGLVRAHRTCMEAIRAAIGPDSFWLGCGTHYASGAGLMDATRISADMRVHYPNLLSCARSAIFNFHLHGGAFLVDPDFAVFRGRDTSLPGMLEVPADGTKPYDRLRGDSGPTFSLSEAQLWAAVLIMSGGVLMLSDRMDGLNEAGLDIVTTLLQHGGGSSALPLDLFASLPQVWRKRHQDATYLLIANWSDAGAVVDIPSSCQLAPGAPLQEVWTGRAMTYSPGMVAELPAHGHWLLRSADPA